MTTKDSPLWKLKVQADKIANSLKRVSRGEVVVNDTGGKIAAALKKESIKVAIFMDDKIIKIDIPWTTIRETDEAGISEWIVRHMQEKADERRN